MYCYHISPIDFAWQQLKTVVETASELASDEAELAVMGASSSEYPEAAEFLSDWKEAKSMAYAEGWEGDFRQGPVVFWVPTSDSFKYGFAFKQDNNGSTFVISPVPMPWLEQ
jgi:hypothetical protein